MFPKWKDRIWPEITHTEIAKKAARQGFWAAVFCASMTAVLSILGHAGIEVFGIKNFGLLELGDAVLYAVIAWRIYKMSRIAAIAGLSLYLYSRINMWVDYGPRNPVIAIIFTLMFINSIRGTFTYHKFVKKQNPGS